MIENCHWGKTVPNATWCPWNYWRSSGDIGVSYASVVKNMLATVPFARQGLSTPGCWAYPDTLVVGTRHWHDGGGLTEVEGYTHFGMWCIMSAPLILSLDVTNSTKMDAAWPIISNTEAIAVNQAWAGESGTPFNQSNTTLTIGTYTKGVPLWQCFSKAVGGGGVAVLLVNHGNTTLDVLGFEFGNVPGLKCSGGAAGAGAGGGNSAGASAGGAGDSSAAGGDTAGSNVGCSVRDVWAQKDLGVFENEYKVHHIASHGSVFLLLY